MHLTKTEILAGAAAVLLLVPTILAAVCDREQSPRSSLPLPAAPNAEGCLLNLNEASAAELMELPGLGEARADAILTHRQQTPLEGPEDLLSVPGIGPSVLRTIEDYITYEGVSP